MLVTYSIYLLSFFCQSASFCHSFCDSSGQTDERNLTIPVLDSHRVMYLGFCIQMHPRWDVKRQSLAAVRTVTPLLQVQTAPDVLV